ncbi:hypothetical protein Plano_0675 [Planococcus sp. PAMC 21323]|uniref:VOC family protein n=1 Tax=Planococcus sp. PAMC 21323 TaxID=1526927 RepID=UPI0005715E0F|nr:VOC family protein [Planococcus sp. PAMC 21323]AIY04640.1 hypothetical protein Plano_0675 [Planococcus sp. PAMC 21323]
MIKKLFPYLNFEGTGREAAHFYTEVLSGKLVGMMTFGDANDGDMEGMPDSAKDLVMNAQIDLKNGDMLMISDVVPGLGMPEFKQGNNITVTLFFDNVEEGRTVFNKLAEEGNIVMELQETFWTPLYGSLTDKFGIDWQISVEVEQN